LDPWFKKKYPLKHLKKMTYWPLQYDVFRNATALLFTSQAEAELAKESFWPNRWNSLVVPYGTNLPKGDREKQREFFLSLCPAVRGRRYLVFMARIHEKKGCDLLLEAFARYADQDPSLDLVIAGPDQVGLKAKLVAFAASRGIGHRVHWPGMLQGDGKWGAFYGAEAFILPSHQENFGIAVAEALACGVPVLISNQVNIWRDILADKTGFVEDDTVEGISRLLDAWIKTSDGERKAIAARCTPSFLNRYSMKEASQAIKNLFSAGI
jgi:glycosyltransferase involved in cell wall biosynthesis